MNPLSGVDGAFLHLETAQTPMHFGSLFLFDLPPGYRGDFCARIKRRLAGRLHLVPIFQRKLAPMSVQFANPVWIPDDEVDLDYHLQRVTLPPPGTLAQFEDCGARLHSELMDRSRPLWRLYVIDGLQDRQVGLYFKAHHAALDGQAAVLVARALFDLTPRPRALRRPQGTSAGHAEQPGMAELAAAALRHDAGQYIKLLRHLPDVLRTLTGMFGASGGAGERQLGQNFAFGPRTPLNVPITAERGFAGLSLPLDVIKRLAAVHDAKLNDVVLALCSGTLRRYLADHGGIPKKPLTAAMPISLREAGNAEYTTQATMPLVNLQSNIADPLRRLRAIRDGAAAVKAMVQRARGVVPMDFPSIGVPWLLQALAALYERSHITSVMPPLANVVVSNIAGPQVPLYAAGARMSTFWPMSIVEHGLGLNITVMSYAGAMGFGFTTARSAVADARQLSHALAAAFDELVAKSRNAKPGSAHQPGAGR
ncbi:MAG: wax ester/triacylglycerol synthase family O-acyltransferase [Caldimonas sp.]